MNPGRTGSRRSRALAWGLGATSVLGFALMVLLSVRRGDPEAAARAASGTATVLPFAALGTLLALRKPANAIGWLLSLGALVWLVNEAADAEVWHALTSSSALSTGVALLAVLNEWIWPLGVLCSASLPLLLFPDGRLRSARWSWVLAAMTGGALLTVVCAALSTQPVTNPVDPSSPIASPWGVQALSAATSTGLELGPLALMASTAAAVAGIVARLRSAADIERQQLRWIASGAVMAIAGVLVFPAAEVLGWPDAAVSIVFALGFTCLPLSFTVAVLRYRLYDLDRLISRTVTYAAVTALLVATYAGVVTAVSRLTPSGSSLAVAASTLAVAALFQPLRRRVQSAVDRRFNRTRYDAERTLDDFRIRLRDEVDLDAVRTDLLDVVRRTVQPEAAGLWLRAAVPASDRRRT